MKKFLITLTLIFLSLTLTTDAHAGMRVNTYQDRVVAEVYNDYDAAIICKGRVYGRTYNGTTYWAWMSNIIIHPGRYGYVYVYTAPSVDPFIQGWSDITCRYL